MKTIAERQAEFEAWYAEWAGIDAGMWAEKSAESLASYIKARLCVTA